MDIHAFGVEGQGVGGIEVGVKCDPFLTVEIAFFVVEADVQLRMDEVVDLWCGAAIDGHLWVGRCAGLRLGVASYGADGDK